MQSRLVIDCDRRAILAVEVAFSFPKLEAARLVLQGKRLRCGEGLSVAVGTKVSQSENPRFFPKKVASISAHDSIRLPIQAGVRDKS
jgi:hypothetical protein